MKLKYILIIIILIAIIIGGIWWYINNSSGEIIPLKEGWNTYKNKEWGIALDYPSSWDLELGEPSPGEGLFWIVIVPPEEPRKAFFEFVVGFPMEEGETIDDKALTKKDFAKSSSFKNALVNTVDIYLLGNRAIRYDITNIYTDGYVTDSDPLQEEIEKHNFLPGELIQIYFKIKRYSGRIVIVSQDIATKERVIFNDILNSLRPI